MNDRSNFLSLKMFLDCRFWNSVIDKPKFWGWARLRVDKDNYKEVLKITPETPKI